MWLCMPETSEKLSLFPFPALQYVWCLCYKNCMTQLLTLTAILKGVLWLWILHSSVHNTQNIKLPNAHLIEEEWPSWLQYIRSDFLCTCALYIPPVQLAGLPAPSWFLYRFSGWIGCHALAFHTYDCLKMEAVAKWLCFPSLTMAKKLTFRCLSPRC